jgi:DNA end-binding protein Ku
MAAKALWKGVLKVGTTKLPIKLLSAARDKTVHFHVLEKRTLARIQQHMVDPETGEAVAEKEIEKGYEIEKGTFVLLDENELTRFEPRATRAIEILEFISPGLIDAQWYERPYWLAPDGDSGNYFSFVDALQSSQREAVARWVMRKKEYVGAIRAEAERLVLITLRYADEILSAEEINAPKAAGLSKGELKMAEQLIGLLRGEFRPEDFEDQYRERLMDFIESKAQGRKPRLRSVRAKRAPTTSLMDQLTKSLKHAKKAA